MNINGIGNYICFIIPTTEKNIIKEIKKYISKDDKLFCFNSVIKIDHSINHYIKSSAYDNICIIRPSIYTPFECLSSLKEQTFTTIKFLDKNIIYFNRKYVNHFNYKDIFNGNIDVSDTSNMTTHHKILDIDTSNITTHHNKTHKEDKELDITNIEQTNIQPVNNHIKEIEYDNYITYISKTNPITIDEQDYIDKNITINTRSKEYGYIQINKKVISNTKEEDFNVCWIPFWEPIEQYASSRLRCKTHHDNLHQYNIKSHLGLIDNPNVIIITQRIKTEEQLKQLERYKKHGVIIIYDLVDKYYTEWFSKRLFNLCNFIIVENDIQMFMLRQYTNTPIRILPDSIDYYNQINPTFTDWNNNICWFGNYTNILPIKNYLNSLSYIYNINVITQAEKIEKHPDINYINWNYDTFIETLRQNSVSILSHGFNDLQKSNNKLLVSISNGVPVIATQSISYRKILNKYGLGEYYCYTYKDILNCIEKLKIEQYRKEYLKCQKHIIDEYKPDTITNRLAKTLKTKPNVVKRNKKVVYTANFGKYDRFNDLKHVNKDIDYLYFTDNKDIKSNKWKVIYVDKPLYNDGNKNAKHYKILTHDVLSQYDSSIWLDSCIEDIRTDFNDYFSMLKNYDLILHTHPDRKCVYEEANACVNMKKDNKNIILEQISDYKMINYPVNNGLYWCGFMVKNHNKLHQFFELWWNEIQTYSKRDQISFPVVFFKHNININMKALYCYDYKKNFTWKGSHLK